MRGDFSAWNKEKAQNFRGVLYQQGRVLLDRDGNAQTEIFNDWQDTAARDLIGAGVAAVPSDAADSFKITQAKVVSGKLEVSVNKGHIWADGLLLSLDNNVVREATYFQSPIQNPAGKLDDLPDKNISDAVILETWLEELNAFQKPELLIEPALVGVDTTERVHTAFRFRLFRMNAGDTCDSIVTRLKDNFDNKGKLTATLQPDNIVDGDCPVIEGGGYTGFEHRLYRMEIAQTRHSQPYFKWSEFNAGLVGRGIFNGSTVTITGNLNAILHSGLTDFYLEALKEVNGYWQVTYGARATLDTSTGTLNLPTAAADVFFGDAPGTETVFFRLWNDVRRVADFAAEADLQDGIRLRFDTADSGKYTPNDFWTLEVRAGEIPNSRTLIDDKPPEGIFYHRVALAELLWKNDTPATSGAEIEDCRRIFQPLTNLKNCCSYRVGDGVTSHGDFTSIQKAIDALPKTGGEICLLPGLFREHIELTAPHNKNIVIKGCGNRTTISGIKSGEPIILVDGGTDLRFENFQIQASLEGVGILLNGNETAAGVVNSKLLRDIEIKNLQITAAYRSAIEMHVGQFVSISDCRIFIHDVATEYAAVVLAGDDLVFEENEIRVMSETATQPWVKTNDPLKYRAAERATGGLHLPGGCERVRVVNNLIMGGIGNGINFGNVDEINGLGIIFRRLTPWWVRVGAQDACNPNPGAIIVGTFTGTTQFIAGAPVRDVLVQGNRILCMGRNGIGVDGFFGRRVITDSTDIFNDLEMISVDNLIIIGNTINRCLNRRQVDISSAMTNLMGFGGVSMADAGNLVIRDNFITDNGANYLNPTCGIFLLHGSGVDISGNQIVNNGIKTAEVATPQTVRNGPRGGIVIEMTTQPTTVSSGDLHGPAALTIRDNVVSVPMGRALKATAMGEVSVTGNRFLSQSVVPGEPHAAGRASHIQLSNLSVAMTLTYAPVYYTDIIRDISVVVVQPNTAARIAAPDSITAGITASDSITPGASATANLSAIGLPYNSFTTQILKRGATLFAHNQCQLFNQTGGRFSSLVRASILINGLDDVAFLSNQCTCILVNDRIKYNTYLIGSTLRASDNFWQEINGTVDFSAGTLAQTLNTTTDNHSSHCVLARGKLYLSKYNLTLVDISVPNYVGNVLNIPAGRQPYCQTQIGDAFPTF